MLNVTKAISIHSKSHRLLIKFVSNVSKPRLIPNFQNRGLVKVSSIFAPCLESPCYGLILKQSKHLYSTKSSQLTNDIPQLKVEIEQKTSNPKLASWMESCLVVGHSPDAYTFESNLEDLESLLEEVGGKDVADQVDQIANFFLSKSSFVVSQEHRIRLVDIITTYYCHFDFLTRAENFLERNIRQFEIKPNASTYARLIQLAGRHKSIPIIQYLFRSWKKSYGIPLTDLNQEKAPANASKLHPASQIVKQAGIVLNTNPDLTKSKSSQILDSLGLKEEDLLNVLVFYQLTILAFAKAKEIGSSYIVFEEAKEYYCGVGALYETMIEAFCMRNRLEQAVGILTDPNFVPSHHSVHTILESCSELGNYHLAERLFKNMKTKFNLTPTIDSWNLMISLYVKRQDMEAAHQTFIDIANSKHHSRRSNPGSNEDQQDDVKIAPNLKSYEILVPGYIKARELDKAIEIIGHAEFHLKSEVSSELMGRLVEAFLLKKDFVHVWKTIDRIIRSDGIDTINGNILSNSSTLNQQQNKRKQVPKQQPLQDTQQQQVQHAQKQLLWSSLDLPNKYKNLLINRVRRHKSQVENFEQRFGPLPESHDDLAQIRSDIAIRRALEAYKIETSRLSKSKNSKQNQHITDPSSPSLHLKEGASESELGYLEEVVEEEGEELEDGSDKAKAKWMKDDVGEEGWLDFASFLREQAMNESSEVSRALSKDGGISGGAWMKKSEKFENVFEAAKWKNHEDIQGSFKPKDWHMTEDPLSEPKASTMAAKAEKRRSEARIDSIEREALSELNLLSETVKKERERRRERAAASSPRNLKYGSNGHYGKPNQQTPRGKTRVRQDKAPAGSTFSFR